MRVLYIDSVCKSGSTGKIVYALYTAVNENGGEAAVCYGRGADVDEKNIFKFGLRWETALHAALEDAPAPVQSEIQICFDRSADTWSE